MPARYKTTTLNSKPILSHRKVWILAHGLISKGFHVHHKNGDQFDNRLSNLELLSAGEHAKHHHNGLAAWNKGAAYGETEGYKKSNVSRMANYEETCRKTYELYAAGHTQGRVAEIMGISRRQVCDRLRSHRANSDV